MAMTHWEIHSWNGYSGEGHVGILHMFIYRQTDSHTPECDSPLAFIDRSMLIMFSLLSRDKLD